MFILVWALSVLQRGATMSVPAVQPSSPPAEDPITPPPVTTPPRKASVRLQERWVIPRHACVWSCDLYDPSASVNGAVLFCFAGGFYLLVEMLLHQNQATG